MLLFLPLFSPLAVPPRLSSPASPQPQRDWGSGGCVGSWSHSRSMCAVHVEIHSGKIVQGDSVFCFCFCSVTGVAGVKSMLV